MKPILLVLTSTYLASCIPIPPPHPAVVAVRQEEELLPLYLRSPHNFNPHLQEVLPLTSLLHRGEKPVSFLYFKVHLVLDYYEISVCNIFYTYMYEYVLLVCTTVGRQRGDVFSRKRFSHDLRSRRLLSKRISV